MRVRFYKAATTSLIAGFLLAISLVKAPAQEHKPLTYSDVMRGIEYYYISREIYIPTCRSNDYLGHLFVKCWPKGADNTLGELYIIELDRNGATLFTVNGKSMTKMAGQKEFITKDGHPITVKRWPKPNIDIFEVNKQFIP